MARKSLAEHFADLPDPRVDRTRKHHLDDILMITLTGLLGGATSFETIEAFAECREAWLKTFLKLPNGVPSHDTLYRVFAMLDPKVFAECFANWAKDWMPENGTHIAIDGKSLRGSSGTTFSGCVHLVSAWATEQGLLLGQESVEERSNEIPAIPVLLKTLHLKGALVTIDAAGCQTRILEQIREGRGDYLVSVKGNQEKLLQAVEAKFAQALESDFAAVSVTQHESSEAGHGRREERYVTVIATPEGFSDWPDVACVIQVNREREVKGVNSTTTQYYISSLLGTAEQMGRLIRRHWAIENELHWGLDVVMGEDAHRMSDRNATANLGIVRRLAMTLLAKAPGKKSKPIKMIQAAGNNDYLATALEGLQGI